MPLQVRTLTAEYFMTLSNQTDLVVSIFRVGQQVAMLASEISLFFLGYSVVVAF